MAEEFEYISRDNLPVLRDRVNPAGDIARVCVTNVDENGNPVDSVSSGDAGSAGVVVGRWELESEGAPADETPGAGFWQRKGTGLFFNVIDLDGVDRTNELLAICEVGDRIRIHADGTDKDEYEIASPVGESEFTSASVIAVGLAVNYDDGLVHTTNLDVGDECTVIARFATILDAGIVTQYTQGTTENIAAKIAIGVVALGRGLQDDGFGTPQLAHDVLDFVNDEGAGLDESNDTQRGPAEHVSTEAGPGETGVWRRKKGNTFGEQIVHASELSNQAIGLAFPAALATSPSVVWTQAADPAGSAGQWSKNNSDPQLATQLIFHTTDANPGGATSRAAVLSQLADGHAIVLRRYDATLNDGETNRGQFERYTVTGAAVLNGSVYEIPVVFHSRSNSNLAVGSQAEVAFIFPFPKTDGSGNLLISALSLPLPAGAATSALQLADGHNVTIDNASLGAAVNIQDGGNTITVDGIVAVSSIAAVTKTESVYVPAAAIAATSLSSSSYTTAITGGGTFKAVTFWYTGDEPIEISLDGGTTVHFRMSAGYFLLGLASLSLEESSGTVHVRREVATPTRGRLFITAIR